MHWYVIICANLGGEKFFPIVSFLDKFGREKFYLWYEHYITQL